MKAKMPVRPGEWQSAVDAAHACLVLDSARCYGLVSGGPQIDAERCDHILKSGKALGYHPRPDSIEIFIRGLAGHLSERPLGG